MSTVKIAYIASTGDLRADLVLQGVFGVIKDGVFKIDSSLMKINLIAGLQAQINKTGVDAKYDLREVEVPHEMATVLCSNLVHGLGKKWDAFYKRESEVLEGFARLAIEGERSQVERAVTETLAGLESAEFVFDVNFSNFETADGDLSEAEDESYNAEYDGSNFAQSVFTGGHAIIQKPESMPVTSQISQQHGAYASGRCLIPCKFVMPPQMTESAVVQANTLWPSIVRVLGGRTCQLLLEPNEARFSDLQYHAQVQIAAPPAADPESAEPQAPSM